MKKELSCFFIIFTYKSSSTILLFLSKFLLPFCIFRSTLWINIPFNHYKEDLNIVSDQLGFLLPLDVNQ